MGTINYGNQILTFDYYNPATSQSFNKLNYGIQESGIYSGGTLAKVDSNTISISPLVCYILDTTVDIGVRVETTETIYVTVAEATPYIALRMDWENKASNYMDVVVVAYGDLQNGDLILGKCIYRSGVLQSTFDTTRRDNSILDRTVDRRDYLKVYPTNPESNKVYVDQGTAFVDNTIVEFAGGNSPALTDTILGRIDYITLDGEGNILVEEGNDAADPDPPNYPSDAIVLAQVARGTSRTDVIGTDITQFVFDKVSSAGGGTTTSTYIATENISANEIVALNASGQAIVASKDDEDKVNVIGIATEAVTAGSEGVFQKIGLLENFAGLTPGSPCYLGNSGAIIQDESSIDESEFRVFIGIAKTATILDVSVEESSLNALRKGTICTYTTGENISSSEVVAVDASGNAIVASKDEDTKIEVVGIAIETITSGNEIQVQKTGILDGFTGLTAGSPCFLGNNGVIIQDDDSVGANEYRVYLGIAKSTTAIDINIAEATYNYVVGDDGGVTANFTAVDAISAGDFVSVSDDGNVVVGDKRYHSTTKIVGASKSTIIASESDPLTLSVQISGILSGYSSLTPGKKCFLSDSGGVTQDTSTIDDDEFRVFVGYAIDADKIDIRIRNEEDTIGAPFSQVFENEVETDEIIDTGGDYELFDFSTPNVVSSEGRRPFDDYNIVSIPAKLPSDHEFPITHHDNPWVDFSGHGAIGVFDETDNLVSDPEDLTTANWSNTNSTDELTGYYVNGRKYTKIENNSASAGYVQYTVDSGDISGTVVCAQAICRQGNASDSVFILYENTVGNKIYATITWSTESITMTNGTLLHSKWITTTAGKKEVQIVCQSDSVAGSNDLYARCFASANTVSGEYTYWTAIQIEDKDFPTWYTPTSRSNGALSYPMVMPSTGKISGFIRYYPLFSYDTSIDHYLFEWSIDADTRFILYYKESEDKFRIFWENGGTGRSIESQQFDDGSSHDNFFQWIALAFSCDLTTGDTSGSWLKVWADTTVKNNTWDGNIDSFPTSDIPDTLYIGTSDAGGAEAGGLISQLLLYNGELPEATVDSWVSGGVPLITRNRLLGQDSNIELDNFGNLFVNTATVGRDSF